MEDYAEMSGDTPELVKGGSLDLATLGGPGAELTTGLILTWRDRLLFAIEPNATPLSTERGGVGAFVGIGGHLEAGESWVDAVVREAREEAGCEIALGDSPVTYLCRPGVDPSPISFAWNGRYRPLLAWVATFQLRRGPQRVRSDVTLVTTVFRAAALNRPKPGSEIPALIAMDRETLLAAYEEPQTLQDLEARGALVIGEPPAAETLLAPGGSAHFFAAWLAWQDRG